MRYSRIVGTGSFLPERILTNHDLEEMVNTSDQWIRERTGIEQRHIAAEGETTADLGEMAARRALEAAGIEPHEVDLIVMGTTTADVVFPSTACIVQSRLGCTGGAAFDINAACTGFIYGLSVADKFIRDGSAKCALVIGSETLSRMVDWSDRDTCVLFGDGAGAVVLKPADEPGVRSTHIHADGSHADLLRTSVGVSSGFKAEPRGGLHITMRGNEVFKVAVRTLGRIADETLAANGLDKADIDWLIPHQANHRIIAATARKLKLSMEQVVVTVNKHGNTSTASVPLALDTAIRNGQIRRGDTLLLEAFGGGFTWGSALVTY